MSVRKRITSLLFAVIVICSFLLCPFRISALSVSAVSAILIDAESEMILFEKNAHQSLPMASTTKIMTAVVAIEAGDLDRTVAIPREAVGVEGSSIYLCEGEFLTIEQLLYALMLSSANDAATAIAIAVAGSEDAFVEMMNSKAKKIGLEHTHFYNPHGLDSNSHFTTAHDLAKLSAYALRLPKFKAVASTYKHQIPFAGQENARLLVNHNKLLKTYNGTIGIKTGFTKKSGRCLVSAAEKDGTTLIAVTLNAPNDWKDHSAMLDYGFDNYVSVDLTQGFEIINIPIISGTANSVSCAPKGNLKVLLPKDHGTVVCRIEIKRFIYAPTIMGECVGQIVCFCDGREIGKIEIVTVESVYLKDQKRTIWDIISDFLQSKGFL